MLRIVFVCIMLFSLSVSFSQVKEKKKSSLHFTVFGDWGRNGEDNQREVAKEMGDMAKIFKTLFYSLHR